MSEPKQAASGAPDPALDPEILALLDFEPVPVRPRVNGWDAEAQRAFIALLATTGSKLLAARALGRNSAGIDRMLDRDDATAFGEAYDAALLLFQERSGRFLTGGVAAAAASARVKASFASAERDINDRPRQSGQVLNEHGEWEDEESYRRRGEEAKDSIGGKLVRIRRLFLQEISACPGKRAAFEILTELPVDWELAEQLEPQPFEPWTRTNQRQPDMVLTAESGWMSGLVPYGPPKVQELRVAIDRHRAEQGLPPVEWDGSAENSEQARSAT